MVSRQATYMDDIQVACRWNRLTHQVCCQLKSNMYSLGNQVADCKYRQKSTTPGTWKGEIILMNTPFPQKSTTDKKWSKFRDGIHRIAAAANSLGHIETSDLCSITGLRVNVTEVYHYGRVYLKGFFNALEAFREC